jgi:hypothetical protein
LIFGCSKSLQHISTISIAPIEIRDPDFAYDNASQRPYDEVIREKLIERFNSKWQSGNDAELIIRIDDYQLKPHGFGPNGNVEVVRMTLQVEYQFIDKIRNKTIEESDNYIQIHDFYIVPNRAEPMRTSEQARSLIVEELVEDLYSGLVGM